MDFDAVLCDGPAGNTTGKNHYPNPLPADLEATHYLNTAKKEESWRAVLLLAYQSLGVVYGDLSTSPLYVFRNSFAEEDIEHSETNEEIFGVLSFVFWTLTLIPLLKYVFIVLRADDNGEGGTFALYSLLCRHARISLLPNCQVADEDISAYKNTSPSRVVFTVRRLLEKHSTLQRLLLLLALVGAAMVIGDGILTPSLSVLSAVSGLELSVSREHHKYLEVPVACLVLVGLFALQHYGTHRVGFLFAPIIITWLACISTIGVYNIFKWNPYVYKALSPVYMYEFLKKTQTSGWMSLGGIILCVTGSEAMFADLGHFSQTSIKIAFSCVVYPSLILAYMGQAAYLSKHHLIAEDHHIGFYISVPEQLRWPVLVVAIMAAVVGSQAVITGTFSIIKQCSALECFPPVKIVHTSSKIHGQIYIPEINWMLMVLCLSVTIGFRDTKQLGNASGLAVITVMLVTTCLMSLVIVLCWKKSISVAFCFLVFFGLIESLYFSASIVKFLRGAWVPITISLAFMLVMYVWHYGTILKYEFDVQNKVSINWILGLGPNLGIVRVQGIGVISTELVTGIPAIFSHFVTNLPAFHQVLVFLCIKHVPVPYVRAEERFLIGRIGSNEYRIYRCIVRYGYRDIHMDDGEFEKELVCSIAEFIRSQSHVQNSNAGSTGSDHDNQLMVVPNNNTAMRFSEDISEGPSNSKPNPKVISTKKKVRFNLPPNSPQLHPSVEAELCELMNAREAGMAFIFGHTHMKARKGSSVVKKLAIDIGYDFLRRNCRGHEFAMGIPHASMLEVGMVYHV